MAQIFTTRVWTPELKAEAQALRDELLALVDDGQEPRAELPAAPRRAVADPAAEQQRAVERAEAEERRRWSRVVGMRRGVMSAVVWDPERSAQRAAARRQQREHTSGLVRDGFRPWR